MPGGLGGVGGGMPGGLGGVGVGVRVALGAARSADAPHMARLILESATQFLPACFGPRIGAVIERLAEEPSNLFSHEHARLARAEGRIVGMLLGYTGRQKRAEELRTGLLLFRWLRGSLLLRLPTLLRLQGTIGRIPSDSFYISSVASDPALRGRGIGSALIADAERTARSAGATAVCLDVETDNERAIRLYERLGLRIERTSPAVELGGRLFALHRMAKPIAGVRAEGEAP